MELKFADEENKPNPSGGLRFSDDNRETEGLKFTGSENQAGNGLKLSGSESQTGNGLKLSGSESQIGNGLKLSGSESQTGNGLNFSGNENQPSNGLNLTGEQPQKPREEKMEKNPWDVEEPIVISTTSATTETDSYTKRRNDEKALKVTQILMYVLMIAAIASVAWVSTQPLVDVYVNLIKFQWLFSFLSIIMLVDLILVCVLWGPKISLILVGIFFGFWYPKKRNDYVNGQGGMGAILGIGYVVAILVFCGLIFKAGVRYGVVLQKDEATRMEVAAVLDQITENGTTMGDEISDNIVVADVNIEEQNGKSVVVLWGTGKIYMEDDVFVQGTEQNVVTQMAFVKDSSTGEYKIAAVALDETTLSEYGAISYWNIILEN